MRLAAIAAMALAACVETRFAPRLDPGVGLEDDEAGLWRLSAELQRELDGTGRLLADPALDAYLLSVARRLEPPAAFAAIPFRFRVVRDAEPNAFCLPNGAVYVSTGILARAESEAELAVLLGHELTHATHRHALRQLRVGENRGRATLAGMSPSGGGLLKLAAVAGYSRDLEREADREGVALAGAAGYDVADGERLFGRLRDWAAAEGERAPAAFFATHPRLEERIASLRAILAARPASGGVREPDAYARATLGAVAEDAMLLAASGRLAAARTEAERYVATRPGDARGHLLMAEIARRDAEPASADAAIAGYRRALERDQALADAWRGIGLVLRRTGDGAGARAALARYLELAPDASDRAQVRALLDAPPEGKP